LNYALAFLLLLFPLVIFHEMGHFLVAKLFGIRVTKFAFGFGRELFRFHFKGTDYRWNLIPLGGYVDLMGEVSVIGKIPEDPAHFYNRPKWVRFLVMVMGPLFNLILAFLLYWFIFAQPQRVVVIQDNPLTVGFVVESSPEYRAGLRPGDKILTINGVEIGTFDKAFQELVLLPKKEALLEVERDGLPVEVKYVVPASEKDGVGEISFSPGIYMVVDEVVSGSPAETAGLEAGDIILEAEGQKLFYSGLHNMLSEVIDKKAGDGVSLTLNRQGQTLQTEVTPEPSEEGKLLIGVRLMFDYESRDPSWGEAARLGWSEFKTSSTMIFRAIRLLTKGDLPVKSLSGPIELGRVAKEQLERGWINFLGLMALLSLNLGIFNLIPIPVLDGGEIFVLLIEGVTRREFSLQTKFNIKIVGFLLLLGLMAVILVSDALKLFS